MLSTTAVGLALGVCLACTALSLGSERTEDNEAKMVRTLLLTGENNHNWRYTSRVHKDTLEATGRFSVDIADDAPAALADAEAVKGYGLFILDYNGPRWGEEAEANFLTAVAGGAGVVVIHAANNAFDGWTAYEQMCGLLWREGTSHGGFHEFDVEIVDRDHPIGSGLDDLKAHPDELYHNLAHRHDAPYKLIAQAFSSTESGGSGKDEPVALVTNYGTGRVFHTTLGHVWAGAHDQKKSIHDPQFQTLLARGAEWAATGDVTMSQWSDIRVHNTLSNAEAREGWELLFDGKSTEHFRGFKQEGFPGQGWAAENGNLRAHARGGGGDIVTQEQYGDFEFACEWKVGEGGNSGIMYRVSEERNWPWETGPELQILDDKTHSDGRNTLTSAGSLYALYACAHDVARPAGEWNHARIVLKGNHLEHWLNGIKVVDCELWNDEFTKLYEASKFVKMPGFGRETEGYIALQDHGDDVWFRNIKVRSLD